MEIDAKTIKGYPRFRNWLWYIHSYGDQVYPTVDLLKAAADDAPYVKVLLYYTYNKSFYYCIKKPIRLKTKYDRPDPDNETVGKTVDATYKEFCSILDKLISNEITFKQGREELYELHKTLNRYTRWVYNCVLDRNLKLGLRYTKIKELFPDLFDEFPVQLYTIHKRFRPEHYQFPLYVTPLMKPGNSRRYLIVSDQDTYEIISTKGSYPFVNKQFDIPVPPNTVVDGFLYRYREDTGQYKKRRKYTKKDGITRRTLVKIYKYHYKFFVLDCIPLNDFLIGECHIPYKDRLQRAKNLIPDSSSITMANTYLVHNFEELYSMAQKQIEYGLNRSGLLLRTPDSKYAKGANGNWVSMRPRHFDGLRQLIKRKGAYQQLMETNQNPSKSIKKFIKIFD